MSTDALQNARVIVGWFILLLILAGLAYELHGIWTSKRSKRIITLLWLSHALLYYLAIAIISAHGELIDSSISLYLNLWNSVVSIHFIGSIIAYNVMADR